MVGRRIHVMLKSTFSIFPRLLERKRVLEMLQTARWWWSKHGRLGVEIMHAFLPVLKFAIVFPRGSYFPTFGNCSCSEVKKSGSVYTGDRENIYWPEPNMTCPYRFILKDTTKPRQTSPYWFGAGNHVLIYIYHLYMVAMTLRAMSMLLYPILVFRGVLIIAEG